MTLTVYTLGKAKGLEPGIVVPRSELELRTIPSQPTAKKKVRELTTACYLHDNYFVLRNFFVH
jgi:hypothetical protein